MLVYFTEAFKALGPLLQFLLVGVLLLMSIDGMRLVFRGTRDYIHATLGKSKLAGRIAGTVAAICLFSSGWAPVLTVVAWIGGVRMFGKWDNPNV